MSNGNSPRSQPESDAAADTTSGNGASGEGAGSAMEAMRKKRQMRVNSPPEPAASPKTQQGSTQAEE